VGGWCLLTKGSVKVMAAKITVGELVQYATDLQYLEKWIDPQLKELRAKKDDVGMRLEAVLTRMNNLKHRFMGTEVTVK